MIADKPITLTPAVHAHGVNIQQNESYFAAHGCIHFSHKASTIEDLALQHQKQPHQAKYTTHT